MKPFFHGFLFAGLLLLNASPLFGQAELPLAIPHFESTMLYHSSEPPMGVLGLPLGTFAVIEGSEHHTSKNWGSDDFVVESINGKKVEHELRIQTDWPSQLPDKCVPGNRYVLHGYESGKWQGQPDGLPKGEPLGWTQGAGFVFDHIFSVTSVEQVNGVTVADARPLDPKVGLFEPDFDAKPDDARPIGILGLPLGTFAIIEVHPPPQGHFLLMERPFQVDSVNGKPLTEAHYLTIRNVPWKQGGPRVTLRGFEAGEWASQPDLPKSENPSGPVPQQPFRFYCDFVVTTPVKSGR